MAVHTLLKARSYFKDIQGGVRIGTPGNARFELNVSVEEANGGRRKALLQRKAHGQWTYGRRKLVIPEEFIAGHCGDKSKESTADSALG